VDDGEDGFDGGVGNDAEAEVEDVALVFGWQIDEMDLNRSTVSSICAKNLLKNDYTRSKGHLGSD
jgi:hypothetical protein